MLLHEARTTGREAFTQRAWAQAYTALTAVDRDDRLDVDELEELALAAYLTGHDDDHDRAQERLHRACLEAGDPERAACCAFWLALALFRRGEPARAGGWLGRAHTVLAEHGDPDCAVRGLLLVPVGLQQLGAGDSGAAHETFTSVAELGRRFGDADVVVLGLLGQGQALVDRGDAPRGLGLLDQAMVAVTADSVSPVVTGIVYCAVIETCHLAFDLRRAQEWTDVLTRWCAEQPDLVPYRGQCLVHRAQVLALRGRWPAALDELRRARDHLSDPPGQPAVGMAWYETGELLRLQGRHDEAEDGYRQASRQGHPPQPGLALLRLAQGRTGDARAGLEGALDTTGSGGPRWRLLTAAVEIGCAAGDRAAARAAADELSTAAKETDADWLHAMAASATGRVLVAEDDHRAAAGVLRRAWSAWRGLDVPHEEARTRALLATVCRVLGDRDGADFEEDAARDTFERLGATDDLAALAAPGPPDAPPGAPAGAPPGALPGAPAGELTGRELEVLRLVARGCTNRQVATELHLSEHTVRRHLQNVFTRLGVPSRAAATAYALRHDLL